MRIKNYIPFIFLIFIFSFIFGYYNSIYLGSDDSYIYLGYLKEFYANFPNGLFSYNLNEHSGGTTSILYYYLLILISVIFSFFRFFLLDSDFYILCTNILNSILWITTFIIISKLLKYKYQQKEQLSQVIFYLIFLSIVPCFSILFDISKKYSIEFIWGFFSGLEGSLISMLLTYLTYLILLCKKENINNLLLSHKYILTLSAVFLARPEWLPVSFILSIPTLFLIIKNNYYKILILPLLLIFVCYFPFYLYTGSLYNSALGSRIEIDPSKISYYNFIINFNFLAKTFWFKILTALTLLSLATRHWNALIVCLILLFSFLIRALFTLLDYNVMERYISYFWIIYILIFYLTIFKNERLNIIINSFISKINKNFLNIVVLFLTLISSYIFFKEYIKDINEMNAVVVEPAKWIKENIPENAKICMEPAGALRLWTNSYLIDLIGLTTDHYSTNEDHNVEKIISEHNIDYCFIYPILFLDWKNKFATVKCWEVVPRTSGGTICLYDLKSKVNSELDKQYKIVNQDPSTNNYLELSKLFYLEKRYNNGNILLLKLLKEVPENALVLNNLGANYMALKDWKNAIIYLEKAININPNLQIAKNNLSFVMSQK